MNKGLRIVTIKEKMHRVEKRLADMDKNGIDVQVLSLSTPGVDCFDAKKSVSVARMVNDEMAKITEKYRGRFYALASLPLKDVPAAIDELERSVKDLGMKGVILQSDVDGRPLDSPDFLPLYEKIASMDLPISIHPGTPIVGGVVAEYRLGPMVGFIFDTTLAMLRLILSGVLEKIPNLKLVLAHLGGMLPYVVDRLDFCYRAYPEARVNISRPISEYLKRAYYDTVSFYEPAIMCAYALTGSKGLVFGTDYPHVIGSIERAVKTVAGLKIPEEEKWEIFGGNAYQLLKLK